MTSIDLIKNKKECATHKNRKTLQILRPFVEAFVKPTGKVGCDFKQKQTKKWRKKTTTGSGDIVESKK